MFIWVHLYPCALQITWRGAAFWNTRKTNNNSKEMKIIIIMVVDKWLHSLSIKRGVFEWGLSKERRYCWWSYLRKRNSSFSFPKYSAILISNKNSRYLFKLGIWTMNMGLLRTNCPRSNEGIGGDYKSRVLKKPINVKSQ